MFFERNQPSQISHRKLWGGLFRTTVPTPAVFRMQDGLCAQQLLDVKGILVERCNPWVTNRFVSDGVAQPGILDNFKSESFFLPVSSLAMNSLYWWSMDF